jgi:peptide/nickel transport system ATP-binding protein
LSDALIATTGLSVAFGSGANRIVAVRDVSLTLGSGEAIGIVGESGSGKSTLARLRRPPASRCRIGSCATESIHRVIAPTRAMRRHVQMVFQDPYSLNHA